MKNTLVLLVIYILITSCGITNFFKNYDKPNYSYSENSTLLPDKSTISTDLKLSFGTLEKEINQLMSKGYSDSGTGEFSKQYRAKSKNPLYNPNKTIKEKNPFYSPNKMISKRISGKIGFIKFSKTIKAKNPLYNPNKWVYSDNPFYNPNKWVYADAIKLDVGYTYHYEFKKRKNIEFISLSGNVLRVVVPIEVKGNFGFKGDGAKLLSLTGKNFKSKLDIIIDTKIGINEDWCPQVSAEIQHKWIDVPQVEIAHNLWVELKTPGELAMKFGKEKIGELISQSIPCKEIQFSAKKIFIPGSISLENIDNTFGLTKDMYLNYSIDKVGLSNLLVKPTSLNLILNAEMTSSIGEKSTKKAPLNLPKLSKITTSDNFVNLSIPASIKYKTLLKNVNTLLKDSLDYTFDTKFKIGDKIINLKNINVKVKGFELYPSDSLITIGVKLSAKFPNKFLSTNGTIYLTAKPQVIKDEFSLSEIDFTTKVDNPLYPLVNSIFSQKIANLIKSKTKKDLRPLFLEGVKLGEDLLDKKLLEVNLIEIQRFKPIIFVSDIIINQKELIIVPKIASGIKVSIVKN